ncbi:MAG: hypothetical protein ACYC6Y_31005, partial [Thermoguttaceae bacterium]
MPLRGRMVLVAATLGMLGAATSQGVEPNAALPESPAADLVPRALEAMGGAEEIAFAVRGMYSDGH